MSSRIKRKRLDHVAAGHAYIDDVIDLTRAAGVLDSYAQQLYDNSRDDIGRGHAAEIQRLADRLFNIATTWEDR